MYNFDTVLYQFLETGTSDRTLLGLDQPLKFFGFSLYPISFVLYSPFKWHKFIFLKIRKKSLIFVSLKKFNPFTNIVINKL